MHRVPRPDHTWALLALLVLASSGAARAEPRVVEIVARRFQFTPNDVTLKKDEPVILRLRSEDVVHSFFMKKLGIDATIEPARRSTCRSRRIKPVRS
ncbi:MAG TPA: cupredoxin domain-containing protein [Candidatus Sulfotelmatobacter sp.]|nr:cupredoxin domain-containing protein [Candidatus Sulfotelmatobacter sp.]